MIARICAIRGNCASMGPRLFSRGNVDASCIDAMHELVLQWGHDFSAVEIMVRLPSDCIGESLASMGPRLFSRGNLHVEHCSRMSTRRSFNGATTFQPWKWRPFFGLCRYRKIGHFREVLQLSWSFLQSASVFAGVFAVWRRFERTPVLPEPHNLSKRPLAINLSFA